ncbi:MAG TPA: adenine-specific DNA-methyltransferase [Candidatus Acidoferrum sp.]|nr:adenine-specific DNA-methyltransferase [Candidatus Acidoferrum sp.]
MKKILIRVHAMKPFKKYSGNNATILLGDSLQVLNEIPDETVDLIFADPPYNIGKQFGTFKDSWSSDKDYADWCYQWLQLCIMKLKPTGSLYVMTSTQAMPYLDLWLRDRVKILSRIVWHYDSSGVQAKKYFGSLYEPIIFAVKDSKNYTFNATDIEVEAKTGAKRKLIDYRKEVPTQYKTTKIPGNTWYIPRVRYRMPEYEEHPSQKPEALLERVIKASSNPGDVVLDPFGGTFTTCAVAQRLGRKTIGIESQEDYIKIGIRRLGISREFNGISLTAPEKTYVRKNFNGVRGATEKQQEDLFNGAI